MEKKNKNLKRGADERIQSVTNKSAAHAFIFLVYYLFISTIIKSFTLDVNIFFYYDYAIAMAIGIGYMIYRSADEGVAVAPAAVKVLNTAYIKVFAVASLLLGLFIAFVISGMDGRLAALMPGIWEKLAGALGFGVLFFLMMTTITWLVDVLPTKMAFRKAAKLSGEPSDKLPDEEEVIKQSYAKDERIDSITEKFSAHAFYFLVSYISISTLVKFFMPDLNLIVYCDAFLAAMVAGGYFTFRMLRAGVYGEQKNGNKENVSGWLTFSTYCLVFGLFVSFIVLPMDEGLAITLESFSSKLFVGLVLAALFGIMMSLFDKLYQWFGKKNADKLMESD